MVPGGRALAGWAACEQLAVDTVIFVTRKAARAGEVSSCEGPVGTGDSVMGQDSGRCHPLPALVTSRHCAVVSCLSRGSQSSTDQTEIQSQQHCGPSTCPPSSLTRPQPLTARATLTSQGLRPLLAAPAPPTPRPAQKRGLAGS